MDIEINVISGALMAVLGIIILCWQQLRHRRSLSEQLVIIAEKEAAPVRPNNVATKTQSQEAQVEEAQEASDDSMPVPELENLLKRTSEDMQTGSDGELQEVEGRGRCPIGKIQRHSGEMRESAETQSESEESTCLGGENEGMVDMMRKLERAHQQLYARDADIWKLRQGENPPQALRTTKEQGLQHSPNKERNSTEMPKAESMTGSSGRHSGRFDGSRAVSVSGTDTEAVSSSAEEGMEDVTSRSSDLSDWLSVEKERGWSKVRKDHLMTEDVPGQSKAELWSKTNKTQEPRDRIRERLEATEAQLGNAQRGLEQKDAEINALRTSLANAQADSRSREGISGKTRGDAESCKDDDAGSFDDSIAGGTPKGTESIYSTSRRSTKEGKPLSELLKGTGPLGKVLSFRHQSSLRRRKIPTFAQDAMMKFGSSSDVSSRASMSSG